MIKLLLILLVGLVFESTGVILLKKGMTHIGDMNGVTAAEIFRVVKAGATNPQILLGVFFEALFFICLLILMSKSDISFLWPLTALSFVFATFAAMWFLGEQVSDVRGVHQLQRTREGKIRTANFWTIINSVLTSVKFPEQFYPNSPQLPQIYAEISKEEILYAVYRESSKQVWDN
jgi:hypothetical protein